MDEYHIVYCAGHVHDIEVISCDSCHWVSLLIRMVNMTGVARGDKNR